jgi:hypothetical protein
MKWLRPPPGRPRQRSWRRKGKKRGDIALLCLPEPSPRSEAGFQAEARGGLAGPGGVTKGAAALDIAEDGGEVVVVPDRERLEPPLPDAPAGAVMAMVAAGVSGQQPFPHRPRSPSPWGRSTSGSGWA